MTATVEPVYLEAYSTNFLRCRTFGHPWEEYIPVGQADPPWGFRFALRCVTCTTERHDIIDAVGEVSIRRYLYPDGYQGLQANRQECRLELEKREDRKRKARRGHLEVVVA